MNAIAALAGATIPLEVSEFAAEKGVDDCLHPVIELAQEAFPRTVLRVSLGQDAEDETHQFIAIDVETSGLSVETLSAGQRHWSAGVSRVCPSRQAVYFVLGWR